MTVNLSVVLAAVLIFNASAWGKERDLENRTKAMRVIDRSVNPEQYDEYARLAYSGITDYKASHEPLVDIENDQVSTNQSQFDDVKDFREVCMDRDLSDVIFVSESLANGKELTFSCLEDGAVGEIRERSFKIMYSVSEEGMEQVSEIAVLRADPVQAKHHFGIADAAAAAISITAAVKFGGVIAKKYFPNQPDKPLHSAGSGLLAVAGANFSYYMKNMSPGRSAIAGGIFSFLFGVAKEAIDKGTGGHGSVDDIKSNLCGIVVGSIISYIQLKMIDNYHKSQLQMKIPSRQLSF